MKHVLLASLVLLLLPAGSAQAEPIFADTFNSENGGVGVLNYGGFANFVVSGGTVDLIGNGYYDFAPVTTGHGLYVDLDGSTSDAGVMLADAIALLPGTYELSFQLAGNQRNSTSDVVDIRLFLDDVAFVTGAILVDPAQPFVLYEVPFTLVSGGGLTFSFANQGGDNIGALLDNIQLTDASVPDGGMTLGLLGGALIGLGALRRRLRG